MKACVPLLFSPLNINPLIKVEEAAPRGVFGELSNLVPFSNFRICSEPCSLRSKLELSKFAPWLADGYYPAVMDNISWFNRVVKYIHNQTVFTVDVVEYLLGVLDMYFPLASEVLLDEDIYDWMEPNSSVGQPYKKFLGGRQFKRDAFESFNPSDICSDFLQYTSIVNCTLKDEIIKEEKDARLFRPASFDLAVVGTKLFALQNQVLMSDFLQTPIALGMSIPGSDFTELWQQVRDFSPLYNAGDGSSYDAHFTLAMAGVIKEFRKRHLKSHHEWVDKYYDNCYAGYTNIAGFLVQLLGNPSGHYNTSLDNSLAQICLMALVCRELGVKLEDVLFKVVGDDLIYATRDDRVTGEQIVKIGKKYGISMEVQSPGFISYFDLTFCGASPFQNGYTYLARQLASLNFCVRGFSDYLYLQKCCSICSLYYYNTEVYKKVWDHCLAVARSICPSFSGVVRSALVSCSKSTLTQMHNYL